MKNRTRGVCITSLVTMALLWSPSLANSFVVGPPDLIVEEIAGPRTAVVGKIIRVVVKVRNQGGATAVNFRVGVYLSKDQTLNKGDRFIGGIELPFLDTINNEEGSKTQSILILAIPESLKPGVYFIGAMADYTRKVDEQNPDYENNNTKFSSRAIQINL